MDILLTTATITAIATLAAIGIAALPWTERELKQSHDALDALQQARVPVPLADSTHMGAQGMGARAVRTA